MVEIYNYGFNVAEQSDQGQQSIREFQSQYHVRPGSHQLAVIPAQTRMRDTTPKRSELTILLETDIRKSWIAWKIPPSFFNQPLTFSFYLAPSLGSPEKQEVDILKIQTLLKQIPGEKDSQSQGAIIMHMLENLKKNNESIEYIIARMLAILGA